MVTHNTKANTKTKIILPKVTTLNTLSNEEFSYCPKTLGYTEIPSKIPNVNPYKCTKAAVVNPTSMNAIKATISTIIQNFCLYLS